MRERGPVPESGRLDLTDMMTRLAGLMFSEETLQSALDLTARTSRRAFMTAAGGGVTLVREGRVFTAAYTDEIVEQADSLQYELDEGPCLSAWQANDIVRLDDSATDKRWPKWSPLAHEMGLRSALSAPLRAGGMVTGAIKVYSSQAGAFDDGDGELLLLFADQAGVVLANVQGYMDAQQMSDRLREALVGRDLVGQAKGILMEREGIDDEGAFAMLRKASQTENIKLRDKAQAIVETTRRDPQGISR